MDYPLDSIFVPRGIRLFPNAWDCRCRLIAKTETEYSFRMEYNKSEFRLRINEFDKTNWMHYTGWETEKCWACGEMNFYCECDD